MVINWECCAEKWEKFESDVFLYFIKVLLIKKIESQKKLSPQLNFQPILTKLSNAPHLNGYAWDTQNCNS